MENIDICYVHVVHLLPIRYSLWPFGLFYVNLVYFIAIWFIFPPFWYVL
jgi:hypothetical protein